MLQHQVVQSPARLGLTNSSTSPSLQNPTQPKIPSSSSSSSSAAVPHQQPIPTITSSALLPFVPPLPRAQTILLQMANLASKLFEVSPNRSLWLSSFRGYLPTFLSSQTQSSSLLPASSSTKEILSLFTSLQTQLFEAVAELQEILDLQDAKQRISREIKSKDSCLINLAHKLKDAEGLLDILVDDYSDYRSSKRAKTSFDTNQEEEEDDEEINDTRVGSRIKLSDILSYAHRISYTTYAPPEFGAGLAPLRGALPPAPQEEQMRSSQLYNFADLDVGLPKTVENNKERTIEAMVEAPLLQQPKDSDIGGRLGGLLPSNITIPSGWKPGMPVELPKDLPVPPPGWKPGDPLPPLDSIPMPHILEQQVALPLPAPQGLHKPPTEPIQVRHVQLDILDQDDDSSDYSSDEPSSDDDDDDDDDDD